MSNPVPALVDALIAAVRKQKREGAALPIAVFDACAALEAAVPALDEAPIGHAYVALASAKAVEDARTIAKACDDAVARVERLERERADVDALEKDNVNLRALVTSLRASIATHHREMGCVALKPHKDSGEDIDPYELLACITDIGRQRAIQTDTENRLVNAACAHAHCFPASPPDAQTAISRAIDGAVLEGKRAVLREKLDGLDDVIEKLRSGVVVWGTDIENLRGVLVAWLATNPVREAVFADNMPTSPHEDLVLMLSALQAVRSDPNFDELHEVTRGFVLADLARIGRKTKPEAATIPQSVPADVRGALAERQANITFLLSRAARYEKRAAGESTEGRADFCRTAQYVLCEVADELRAGEGCGATLMPQTETLTSYNHPGVIVPRPFIWDARALVRDLVATLGPDDTKDVSLPGLDKADLRARAERLILATEGAAYSSVPRVKEPKA